MAEDSITNKPVSENRIVSVDVFRSLIILTMVFVNHVGGLANIPWWLKHMPTKIDGMTIADLVFSAFLFIVGMSIPLSLDKRIAKGESSIELLPRIIVRAVSLLIVGVFMVNTESYAKEVAWLPKSVWELLMFLSVAAVWNIYPKINQWNLKKKIYTGLRVVGVVLLIVLAIIYKGYDYYGAVAGMTTQWWGILGLIGWAYLVGCIFYLIFRNNMTALVGVIVLLVAVWIGNKGNVFQWMGNVNGFILVGISGLHSAIVMSGIFLTKIIQMKDTSLSDRGNLYKRTLWALTFALFLFCGGVLLRGIWGIHKNGASPAWGLISGAICCVIYLLAYYWIDIKKRGKWWIKLLSPAGANPLLAYILPEIVTSFLVVIGLGGIFNIWTEGVLGIIRSVIFTGIILWLTAILTRLGVRLRF